MKFTCVCGRVIVDGADGHPDKAHVIPDQEAHSVLDAIDAAIADCGSSQHAKVAACMKVRVLLSDISRRAWQCKSCARIWVENKNHGLKAFRPESEGALRGIFRSRVES